MRIDLNPRTPDIPDKTQLESSRTVEKPAGSAPHPQDQATVSLAGRVQSLAGQAAQTPEIRQSRVSALSRAIRNGSYKVSSEQIAEAVFSEMTARASLVR